MTHLIDNFSSFLVNYVSPEVVVAIISILPILELRGGMIVASLLGVPYMTALPIAIIANMLPVPFIIFFIEHVITFLQNHGPFKKMANWLEKKGTSGGKKLMGKHSKSLFLGLFLFVAIPLPGTGAWTGSLVAALLGLSPKKSAPPICLGIVGASIIMSILTYGIPALFK